MSSGGFLLLLLVVKGQTLVRGLLKPTTDDGKDAIVAVPVRQSPVLFGWLAMLGDDAENLHPKALRDCFSDWLQRVLANDEK